MRWADAWVISWWEGNAHMRAANPSRHHNLGQLKMSATIAACACKAQETARISRWPSTLRTPQASRNSHFPNKLMIVA